jgi:hypothetical protein
MKSNKEFLIDHENFDHLHAFLDGELSTKDNQIIEGHVSMCTRCFGHLEELKTLSAALENLEEIPVYINLVPRVLNSIGSKTITLSLGFQLVTATIGLIFVVPMLFGKSIKTDVFQLLGLLFELVQDSFKQQFHQYVNLLSYVSNLLSETNNILINIQVFESHEFVVWPIFISSAILFIAGNYFLLKDMDVSISTAELYK